MSESRFDAIRYAARAARERTRNANVRADCANGDAVYDLVQAVGYLSNVVIDLADEAERAAFGKYAEGRSITA